MPGTNKPVELLLSRNRVITFARPEEYFQYLGFSAHRFHSNRLLKFCKTNECNSKGLNCISLCSFYFLFKCLKHSSEGSSKHRGGSNPSLGVVFPTMDDFKEILKDKLLPTLLSKESRRWVMCHTRSLERWLFTLPTYNSACNNALLFVPNTR